MTTPDATREGYVSVADLEIDAVTPRPHGFTMLASGGDSADYLVEMHLDMPIDRRTRAVLGEMLSQTELRVWRRPKEPLRARWKRNATANPTPPTGTT